MFLRFDLGPERSLPRRGARGRLQRRSSLRGIDSRWRGRRNVALLVTGRRERLLRRPWGGRGQTGGLRFFICTFPQRLQRVRRGGKRRRSKRDDRRIFDGWTAALRRWVSRRVGREEFPLLGSTLHDRRGDPRGLLLGRGAVAFQDLHARCHHSRLRVISIHINCLAKT